MQTYLGLSQRTANGRFLYGRPKNYRLNSCLLCLRNPDNDLGLMAPTTGGAPLTVNATAPTFPVNTLTPGINSAWPAPAAGGMSSQLASGGIAVQGSGYARIDTPPAITPSQTWVWGDGNPDESVASASVTPHDYDAGTWTPELVCKDALARENTQTMDDILVGPVAPTGLVAVGGALQISLTWNAVAGATSYNVYRSDTSGGAQTLIASGLTSPAHIDTPLPAATARFYKVAAVNASAVGTQSAEATATTDP